MILCTSFILFFVLKNNISRGWTKIGTLSPVSLSSCYLLFIGENSKSLVFHCNSTEWCAMKMHDL